MADDKPTSNNYNNLGGVNQKASQYEMSTAQFLNLRNMDFDVPKALQKRPGQTYALGSGSGTSGPINSLFEFVKLDGTSFVMAASDTAIYFLNSGVYSLLDTVWNNGQPPDMLTFVNKLWIANGQKYKVWDGSTLLTVGLPIAPTVLNSAVDSSTAGASYFYVGGVTMTPLANPSFASYIVRGVYVAYGYLRNDGYLGPIDFLNSARNIVAIGQSDNCTPASGSDWFGGRGVYLVGFTVPASVSATGIAVYIGVDTVSAASSSTGAGSLGAFYNTGLNFMEMSPTLLPGADLSQFQLYTIIPTSSLFLTTTAGLKVTGNDSVSIGNTFWAATLTLGSSFFAKFTSKQFGVGFSGMPGDFFTTYTPKYIEIDQNYMFSAGFSSAPSTVWISDLGEPEIIDPQNNFEARTNDGDRIYAIKAFLNQLVVFKEHSFQKLIGNSPDNFQLVELTTDYGCLSNRAIVTVDQKLYFLDKKGIIVYNGAGWEVLSGPIEPVFRRMNISAAKEKATAVHHVYRNQIWFGIPVDGSSQNNLTVVYDYLVGAWTFFDGFSAASFAFIKGQLSRPTAWRGDYSGLVHYFGESFYSDSGAGITCLGLTRFENEGGENQSTIWRRFFLDVATATGLTGTINGQVFSNYDQSTVRATFAIYQNQFQTRAEMGVVGKAVACQFAHYSASLPLLVNGYGWAKRGLRNV